MGGAGGEGRVVPTATGKAPDKLPKLPAIPMGLWLPSFGLQWRG